MKIKLLKCGICDSWNRPGHCAHCGAYALPHPGNGRRIFLNAFGVEMVRGIPPSYHDVIQRLVNSVQEHKS